VCVCKKEMLHNTTIRFGFKLKHDNLGQQHRQQQ